MFTYKNHKTMKKQLVIAVCSLFLLSPLMGQESELSFGIQLSPSFSWMSTDDNRINSSGSNLGLQLSMMAEYYFRENYAVTSGIGFHFNSGGRLQFEEGGSYWTDSDLGPNLDSLPDGVKLRYNLQYVQIPLGLKLRTREFGYFRYFVEPNLALGINTQAQGDLEGRGIGSDAENINIKEEVRSVGAFWGLGAGTEYSISQSTTLLAGLYFQTSFTDVTKDSGTIFDDDRGNQNEDSKAKINSLTLRLAVLF